jgi:tight adherence protein B
MTDGAFVFVAIVFVAVFLLAQGMIVPVFGESRVVRKRLKRRLGEIEAELGTETFSSLLREKYLRDLSPLERWLEGLPFMEGLAATIEQAGKSTRAYRVVLLAAILAVVPGAMVWAYTNQPAIALIAALGGGALPFIVVMRARTQRIQIIEEQLPEAIDMLKRAMRAGHPFNGAVKLVGEEMPEPIAKEFRSTFADINYGNDVRRAMLGLLQRNPSVPVMALVTSVLVQKETGGNLAEILEQISTVIRGRFRLDRKVRTLSAEGRMSTWILALVPLVLFAVVWITTPDYLPTLLESEVGEKLIAYGLISAVVGAIWIRKIIRIEV